MKIHNAIKNYVLKLDKKFGQEIELGYDFWIGGLLLFALVLVYNQNNPVRFVKMILYLLNSSTISTQFVVFSELMR